MSLWLVIFLAGLVTYLTRLSFILVLGRLAMPAWFRRSLRLVPPAVFSAITLPELTSPAGRLDISVHNARLLAGLVAILVAWRTRNLLLTVLAGAVALLLFQALLAR